MGLTALWPAGLPQRLGEGQLLASAVLVAAGDLGLGLQPFNLCLSVSARRPLSDEDICDGT